MKADFTRQLMKWNQHANTRSMPWKGEKDPYKIWLSEIILQQTRVEQGLGYYNQFVSTFPTIGQLAKAPEKKIFKLWEGLGYYTRCKNLIATAKWITKERKGKFPNAYADILALNGIGPYTAAAIASFAFNLPHAVVDGNVFRVLSRYFGISTPIDSNEGKKLYAQIAYELLDKKEPGLFNQAIMDLGAVICKPQQPLCEKCPQKKNCRAFQHDWIKILPVKEKKGKKKTRWFYYFIMQLDNSLLIRKRNEKDIWENLYEFVLYESDGVLIPGKKTWLPVLKKWFGKNPVSVTAVSGIFRQQLTHQTIHGQFISVDINMVPASLNDYELVKTTAIKKHPFPKLITSYLQQKAKPLQLF